MPWVALTSLSKGYQSPPTLDKTCRARAGEHSPGKSRSRRRGDRSTRSSDRSWYAAWFDTARTLGFASLVRAIHEVRKGRSMILQPLGSNATTSRTRFELEMLTLYGDLCARAFALTKDHDAAADLVQQACERGLRAKSSLGDGTNAGAWLKCVIRNLFIDEYRSRQKQAPLQGDVAAESIENGPPALADILTIDEVKQEMQAMPQADRVILALALFEDCSYREISTRLGILPKTVGTRLFRAKAKLRKRMQLVYEQRLAALTRVP